MTAQPPEPAVPSPDGPPRRKGSGHRWPSGAPRGGPSRTGRLSRRSLVLSGALLAVVWLVLVFGSALADVDAAHRRAEQTRADNAALQERLEQGRAEIELMQTDEFLRQQARAYGMGERGERAFALEAGTPLMEPIPPLGISLEPPAARSPLEEWFLLLFG